MTFASLRRHSARATGAAVGWLRGGLAFLLLAGAPLPGWAGDEPIYAGRSLPEWRELIKQVSPDASIDPKVVDGLLQIAEDPHAPWADRRQSALTLGRIGESAAAVIPRLQRLLANDEADPLSTQLWTLRSLALFGPLAEGATADVAQMVTDRSQPQILRMTAMETLGRIGAERRETLPALVSVLESDREVDTPGDVRELRLVAAESLGLLGPGASGALPALLRASRDEWPLLRRGACQTIGRIGPRADIAIPTLIDIVLLDEAGETQEAAAEALGQIGPAALPAITRLLQVDDESVQCLGIRALRASGNSPGVLELLHRMLGDTVPRVRVEAAAACLFLNSDDDRALKTLVESLDSPDRRARLESYRTLLKYTDRLTSYQPALQDLAENESAHPQTREAASKLLRQMDPGDPSGDSRK